MDTNASSPSPETDPDPVVHPYSRGGDGDPRPPKSKVRLFLFGLGALVCFAIGYETFLIPGTASLWHGTWVEVPCIVTESGMRHARAVAKDVYVPEVTYTYRFGEREYERHSVAIRELQLFETREELDDYLAPLVTGGSRNARPGACGSTQQVVASPVTSGAK